MGAYFYGEGRGKGGEGEGRGGGRERREKGGEGEGTGGTPQGLGDTPHFQILKNTPGDSQPATQPHCCSYGITLYAIASSLKTKPTLARHLLSIARLIRLLF